MAPEGDAARSWWSRPGALIGAMAAVIAITTGVVALLFELVPGLRPEPPPQAVRAEIVGLTVEPATLDVFIMRFKRTDILDEFEDFITGLEDRLDDPSILDLLGFGAPGLTRRQSALRFGQGFPGLIVYVEVETEGFRQRLESPDVFLYHPIRGTRLPPKAINPELQGLLRPFFVSSATAAPGQRFVPRAKDDRGVATIFLLCSEGRVVVRAELRDDQQRLVDLATSRPVACGR